MKLIKGKSYLTGALAALLIASPTAQAAELNLPPFVNQAVPLNLKPALTLAKSDRSVAYLDRCHVQQNLTAAPVSCVYGDTTSDTTIVLFGDSHALSWFPAIEKLAHLKHWKLVSLTMSSCWPASIPAYNSVKKYLMDNCAVWRDSALKRIADLNPYITFVAGTRGFATVNDTGEVATGEERALIWRQGIASTLSSVTTSSWNTVYLGDIPISIYDTPVCLLANKKSVLNCTTPVSKAIDSDWLVAESTAANSVGAIFIDPSNWICKTDPCSPIEGNKLVYLDGGHLTATFAVTLEKPLWTSLSSKADL